MDAITLLTTRASNGKLTEPEPDANTLRMAFEALARVPDHGALRRLRVRIVRGEARNALGDVLARAHALEHPDAAQDELDRIKSKPLRAPMILVVGAVVVAHPRIPDIEQVLAAGAAAHTLLLVLQARGYAGIWRTGTPAYDPRIKRALGFAPGDALVGFVYAGTPMRSPPSMSRPAAADFVSEWLGPAPE